MTDNFTAQERAEFDFIIKRHHSFALHGDGTVTKGNGDTATDVDDFDRDKWRLARNPVTR